MSANPKQREQVWAKWQKWFDTTAKTVYLMFHDRELHDELRKALAERGPNESGLWPGHYDRMYVAKQAMAARRIMDKTDGAESFWWILRGIERSPKVLDRQRFVGATSNQQQWAVDERHVEFDKLRSPDGDWIDPKVVEYFRLTLEADADALVTFATKTIAHTDPKGGPTLTWADLSKAIDDIGTGFQEFGAVFHGTHYELLPVAQEDWQGPFRRRLFAPNTGWRDMNMMPGG
jgi:hypothetical protein